jgi:hypothetical protein
MTTIKFFPKGTITPEAPTVEQLEQGIDISKYVRTWRPLTPAEELKLRLNSRLHGNDPGKPYNWRGIR